mmetsp:Transcript_5434/g.10948  ORF Transcript_5434/g.10948 Transcript_5434/m.10948 type:complete len:96 (-) Transcript_5434:86-373(-)
MFLQFLVQRRIRKISPWNLSAARFWRAGQNALEAKGAVIGQLVSLMVRMVLVNGSTAGARGLQEKEARGEPNRCTGCILALPLSLASTVLAPRVV